jgi:hypothetical protein
VAIPARDGSRPDADEVAFAYRVAMRSLQQVADEIEAELRAAGTPERAAGERRYLKSDLEFVGATVPAATGVVAAFSLAGTTRRSGPAGSPCARR